MTPRVRYRQASPKLARKEPTKKPSEELDTSKEATKQKPAEEPAIWEDQWCKRGKRNGRVCCSAQCPVCTGQNCIGLCCGGAILKRGLCSGENDTICLIPPRPTPISRSQQASKLPASSGATPPPAAKSQAAPEEVWCRRGKTNKEVCCDASCVVCAGPGCVGRCCGGHIMKQGSCTTLDDVTCIIPQTKQDAAKPKVNSKPVAPSFSKAGFCRDGKLNGRFCCASNCYVCGGEGCVGACCSGYLARLGRRCDGADDTSCILPEDTVEGGQLWFPQDYSPGPHSSEFPEWCANGKRSGRLCCSSTCKACSAEGCSGACCGSYLLRQSRVCTSSTDVSCVIPEDTARMSVSVSSGGGVQRA